VAAPAAVRAHQPGGRLSDPPSADRLAEARPQEGYGGKQIFVRRDALAAYRRMVQAAKAEQPRIAEDPRNLQIFSGFRDPAADAARCALEQNCDGLVRATCSAHRTGAALDLFVGQAPGFGPDATDDASRRYLSQTATYAWLATNARRFGFVNYPFEPWHWEYAGD
jgi:LAS superfamily LD-carboxypeptidase LdcB